jgi:hypothetical protein
VENLKLSEKRRIKKAKTNPNMIANLLKINDIKGKSEGNNSER